MTNKKCEGIDCAWCMSIECPHEKDTTMTNKEQIIDFILNEHSQIVIEGHYSVRAICTTGNGATLDEALQNWYEKYQKNINNLEWRQNYGFEHIPHKHLEQF